MKVAVLIDEKSRKVVPFSSFGLIEIHSDVDGSWKCVDQIPYNLENISKLEEIRLYVECLISEFEDCELIIADGLKGVARALVEDIKIGIWHYSGVLHEDFLNVVKNEIAMAKQELEMNVVTPVLHGEPKDASYEINLAEVLTKNKGMNSMDILIPFLQKTNFKKLSIICDHLPKWFENISNMLYLNYETQDIENEQLKVLVQPEDYDAGFQLRKSIKLNTGGCSGGCGF